MLTRELGEDGFAGVEIRVTPMRTEIIIRATRTQNVLGEKGRRIRELTSVVQKRFNFPDGSVELYAEKVMNRGLCAVAQAESLRYKLLGGLAVRRACYGVLRFVMESGAKGCEVIVSGKLRAQRAKSMKFKDGYMISSGHPVNQYIDGAVRHVLLRQLDDSALDAVMKKLSPRRRTWLEFTCFTAALDKMEVAARGGGPRQRREGDGMDASRFNAVVMSLQSIWLHLAYMFDV
ncbi:40S ribosomal protein S3-3-like isoform X1 [Lolium rigidum]|uniref:40S ribosomal protein S3-3-like isoform X1 n=1 Tax=Lolium rigidum TaxID=89674 RepID=UPI001F5DACB3|nr:40S ribosomal protein S3-3-like isoform X1 [Lolium rigidum]XP_047062715.1 40S ribosomal protein S3-3-like isoform X1 [Lolium rigidum]XP_047062716.1 40S ribosomal protein S3-3-like isoform X1 [Lolium rigidum]XP_047062717.1 40S ribosomal protein S3-3-like isoform X1 [Lolium rigidum]